MIPNYVIKIICDHMPHLRFMAQRKQWQSLARSYLALGSNLTPLDTMKLSHVAEGQGWTPGPHCNECGLHIGESERGARRTTAERIAVEWPYTADQVLVVVNAADGNETIAREALRSTSQIGYGDHLINAARAARSMSTNK